MTQALSFPALFPFLPLFPVLFFSHEIVPIQFGAITANFVKHVDLFLFPLEKSWRNRPEDLGSPSTVALLHQTCQLNSL